MPARQLQGVAGPPLPPVAPAPGPGHRDLLLRTAVGEVGVVGADRDADVAAYAVEELEVAADLAGWRGVGGSGVALVGGEPLDVGLGVGQPRLGDPAGEELPPRGGKQVAALGEGVPTALPDRRAPSRAGALEGVEAPPVGADRQLVDRPCPHLAHPPLELGLVGRQPAVAPLAQEIGAHRDGRQTQGGGVGVVEAVDPGGEGDRETIAELAAEASHQVHGQNVERLTGEIDLLLGGGQEAARVLDDQRVGELHPEGEPQLPRGVPQPADDLHRLAPGRVALEGALRHREVVVAQLVVEQLPGDLGPQQHRVELDDAVEPVLAHEEVDDALDLVRRAAVEGGQRQGVGEPVGVVEIAQRPALFGDLPAQALDDGAAVEHALDERLHARRADAGEVVSHAHVPGQRLEPGRHLHRSALAQDLDEHRPLDVLLERLLQLELLGPLGVQPHRVDVDAGPRDLQLVVDLDGLELLDAAAPQPGEDDVLRHLGLRPGRGAQGARGAPAVEVHGEIEVRVARHEATDRQVEDRLLGVELDEHSAHQGAERVRPQGGHPESLAFGRYSPVCRRASSTRSSSSGGRTFFSSASSRTVRPVLYASLAISAALS